MRRVVTWSTRGWHPWIVIALWVVLAGVLATGPKLQSVTTNDASKSLPASVESKRADALQQASFPDAKGTPIIVVYSSEQPLTDADKAAVAAGEAWLKGGEQPINSARTEFSPDGKGALVFASLNGNPGDESFRDSVDQHPGTLRPHGGLDGGARHRARRVDHRRLQDLPERRHQAAHRDGAAGPGPAAADLPVAHPAVRAAW